MSAILCRYEGQCSGCAWMGSAVQTQRNRKAEILSGKRIPKDLTWVDCGVRALRDRADFSWEDGRLGLYATGKDGGVERIIVDLESCPMLSAPLQEWMELYRSKKPPIKKGSVRLRVSPEGVRGVWLDFANSDVKTLFEEREYLRWLSEHAIVEIGQRRKRLEWVDGAPKLRDPKLEAWFETYGSNGKPIPVYTTIAGFTQSGFVANKKLVQEVLKAVEKTGENRWLELFAGSGNFSLALAAAGKEVVAIEVEEAALEGLRQSCEQSGLTIETIKKDLYRPAPLEGDAWLVDPPRSGLKVLLETIAQSKPKALIYVSCWSESFFADAEKLNELGYTMTSLSAVDQFVHSPHVEWVASFSV